MEERDDYSKHLEAWLKAEELRTSVLTHALNWHGLIRQAVGEEPIHIGMHLTKLRTDLTSKRKIKVFIEVTKHALKGLFGISLEEANFLVEEAEWPRYVFGNIPRGGNLRKSLDRFSAITTIFRQFPPEIGEIIYSRFRDSSGPCVMDNFTQLDWKGALTVYRNDPGLFGIIPSLAGETPIEEDAGSK